MRRAVGIGRASVRSWSGEGIGSVFVGTAAPGTVTQQRRHQASTGGEPIRSRAQFALLTRAWATGRPVSRPDDDDSQLQAGPVKEPLEGASGEEARDGPDDQESRKEIKWKKSKPCQRSKPCHDADKARNHNEEKRRRHEARRAVACKETTAREGGSALKEKRELDGPFRTWSRSRSSVPARGCCSRWTWTWACRAGVASSQWSGCPGRWNP